MSDARQNDTAMIALIQTIQDDVKSIQSALTTHLNTEPKEWAKILSDLMIKSFPQGDAEGHRRYHEATIKSEESKAEFWAKMTYEIKKWGLIGFSLWALKTLIEAAAVWIQHGAHIK